MTTAASEPVVDAAAGRSAIPETVSARLTRGRTQMRKSAPLRRLYYKFWRGETYWYLNSRNALVNQSTVSFLLGGEKPSHRIRNKYPFIAMIVAAKVSAATQRIPSYQVLPSKLDPEAAQAAALSEKVLLWGYDEWHVRRVTTEAFTHAFVGGEGFAYPYFDSSVGPYITDPATGETVGQGEIKTKVLSANEVYWEPGTGFDHSRWYCVEQARTLDEVKAMPGYLGGELSADAIDSDTPRDGDRSNLVRVTEYFERPSEKQRNGRWMVIANGRQIVPESEYPCQDAEGNVLDEPVLVRISYTVEVEDRDRSLVELLIDLQRTIQDSWNKILEWKNRGLNPQKIAPRGSNMARQDDTPGAVWYYNPVGGQKPEWEKPAPIPLQALLAILDKALEHMRALAADVDVQPDPRLTAQTAQAAIEQNQLRWQSFLGDGAEFHSRLARRYLYLVQRHYTEPRLLKIQGMFGPDLTPGFRGADLLDQSDVRVSPDSLASRSRQQVIQDTLLFADRQWITPQAAMAAIQGGVAEKLGEAWQFDVGRANYIIQTIKRGPDALFALPDRPPFPGESPPVDANGAPLLPGPDGQPKVPGYMPRPFDNIAVQKQVFETWMKTTDWDHLAPPMQHAALVYYQALLDLEQQQALRAAQQQAQMAAAQGMQNAARPQDQPMQPSQRMPDRQGDTSAVPQ